MNYRHVYMLIIEHAKKEAKLGLRPKNKKEFSRNRKTNYNPNYYFEFHHILPKSLFPNWSKRESNIVPLTAREHFFCHQLLVKIYPCKELSYALYYMSIKFGKDSRIYEKCKLQYINTYRIGKKLSKETCEKISLAKKGKCWTEAQRRALTNSNNCFVGNCVSWNKGKKGYHINVSEEGKRRKIEANRKNGNTKKALEKARLVDRSGKNNSMYGKKHSEHTLELLRLKAKLRERHYRKVRCITDDIIFNSIIEASKYYNCKVGVIRLSIYYNRFTRFNKIFEYYYN